MWYPKQKNTMDIYTFISEFVAMKQAAKFLKGLKYNLRMFGIEIMENETKCFGNNNAVILNFPVPESRLKKKHHSIIKIMSEKQWPP